MRTVSPELKMKAKETAGRFACLSWILFSILCAYLLPYERILSFRTAIITLCGMFIAALLFGVLIYSIKMGLFKIAIGLQDKGHNTLASFFGFSISLIEYVMLYPIYLTCRYTYLHLPFFGGL